MRTCCFIGCEKPAEWNLHPSNVPYETVDACTQHIGDLLDDAPYTTVTLIALKGKSE